MSVQQRKLITAHGRSNTESLFLTSERWRTHIQFIPWVSKLFYLNTTFVRRCHQYEFGSVYLARKLMQKTSICKVKTIQICNEEMYMFLAEIQPMEKHTKLAKLILHIQWVIFYLNFVYSVACYTTLSFLYTSNLQVHCYYNCFFFFFFFLAGSQLLFVFVSVLHSISLFSSFCKKSLFFCSIYSVAVCSAYIYVNFSLYLLNVFTTFTFLIFALWYPHYLFNFIFCTSVHCLNNVPTKICISYTRIEKKTFQYFYLCFVLMPLKSYF